MPDSYTARGGIAQYSRDLLDALCWSDHVEQVASIPRHRPWGSSDMPPKLAEHPSPGNPVRYTANALAHARGFGPDVILCGHVNLLPVAAVVGRVTRAPVLLQVHGVEIWQRRSESRRRVLHAADCVLAVSRYTRNRLLEWSRLDPHCVRVVPNTIRLDRFRPGERPQYLVERYCTGGRRVLLSLGRLSSREKYKGQDRIIALLPELVCSIPNLLYLIAGDGDDRNRLEALVRQTGVGALVRFVGQVPDGEKTDHYNLADAFALPSTGEGFGIVFLEAAACGVPVLGGSVDGSRDALVDGELGLMVNPANSSELLDGLVTLLKARRGVPAAVERFEFPRFRAHVEQVFLRVAERGRAV